MAKIKEIGEDLVRAVALELLLDSTEIDNIYSTFEKLGVGEVRVKRWIDSHGGIAGARQHLSQLQLSNALLIRPAVKEINRRITEGTISDKELVNLYQGLTGTGKTTNNSKPAVNINIDQFLKEKQKVKVLDAVSTTEPDDE